MPDIKGVEIFATGTHNGDTYTAADLQGMVEVFNEIDFKPVVKVGHTGNSGGPAYGWLSNLRTVVTKGVTKLIADFIDVPQEIYDAIKARRFDRVSAEIWPSLKRMGKTFKNVLTAVALLGEQIPAVAGLKPLRDVVTFSASAEDGVDRRNYLSKLELIKMPKTVEEQLAELQKTVATLTAENAVSKLTYENQLAEERNKTAQAEATTNLIMQNANRERMNVLVSQLKFTALLPYFKVFAELAAGAENAKKYTIDPVKGEQSAVAVLTDCIEKINGSMKVFSESGEQSGQGNPAIDPTKDAGEILNEKALEYRIKAGIPSVYEAFKIIIRDPANAELVKQYNEKNQKTNFTLEY